MARYVRDIVLNKPDDFVQFIMNDYLQKNQFAMSDWKGEPAYRAGDAMVEGFKYLKWSYNNGVFHLEAWLKGTAGGEWDLEGFVGTLQKKPYKDSLEQLFATLQQPLPNEQQMQGGPQNMNQQGMGPGPQGPQGPQNGGPQPTAIPVQTVDNTGAATMALVFGILSVILALVLPFGGIILSVLGFTRARLGSGSSKAGMAKAGKILCIIGLVVAVVNWGLGILLVVTA